MVTVIIRSVGERTESICRDIISNQVDESEVFIVSEIPFSATLKKSLELGIERGQKWTLCIDADILLANGVIKRMLEQAEKQSDETCEIQFHVFDKFFNMTRQAGNHLYRTALLPEVLKRIPEEGTDIRPEFYTLSKMEQDGFPYCSFDEIIGCHDFEQFYNDIFRKMFVHAHKHVEHISYLLSFWRNRIDLDFDFQVALWGLAAGIVYNQEIFINKQKVPYDLINVFSENKLIEKKSLDIKDTVIQMVNDSVSNFNIELLANIKNNSGFDSNKNKNKILSSLKLVYKRLFYQ